MGDVIKGNFGSQSRGEAVSPVRNFDADAVGASLFANMHGVVKPIRSVIDPEVELLSREELIQRASNAIASAQKLCGSILEGVDAEDEDVLDGALDSQGAALSLLTPSEQELAWDQWRKSLLETK